MIRDTTRLDYRKRILRVVEYIHDHLHDDLDMETLAGVAAFSPYHWHRIYRGITGETAVQTVRRLRLHHAAGALVQTHDPISKIAQSAGYQSTAAFTRAFANSYGITPAAYRERGNLTAHDTQPAAAGGKASSMTTHPVTIEQLPGCTIAAVEHRGPYMNIGESFEKLVVMTDALSLLQSGARTVAIYYDDPSAVAPDDLRSEAGIEVPAGYDAKAPLHNISIKGGRHAVMHHKGPYAELEAAYNWLFGVWLPESGEEAANRPTFEFYLNDCKSLPPAEWLTDICLPLAER